MHTSNGVPELAVEPCDRVLTRAAEAGLVLDRDVAEKVLAYFELLAKWNKRLNLTGLDVDLRSDVAIDRLLVEPLVAAGLAGDVSAMIDVGSGGGSPAIPFALGQKPTPRLTMVESRSRKATFLREAMRHVGLAGGVVTDRFERFASAAPKDAAFDVLTVRAVRPDGDLWGSALLVLSPGGRIFWFHGEGQDVTDRTPGLVWGPPVLLVPSLRSFLTVGTRMG